jgi:hypothetical protein
MQIFRLGERGDGMSVFAVKVVTQHSPIGLIVGRVEPPRSQVRFKLATARPRPLPKAKAAAPGDGMQLLYFRKAVAFVAAVPHGAACLKVREVIPRHQVAG